MQICSIPCLDPSSESSVKFVNLTFPNVHSVNLVEEAIYNDENKLHQCIEANNILGIRKRSDTCLHN